MNSNSFFFFQAEDGIRDLTVTGVQTCALPISHVLPTGGTARYVSPLGVYDFVKRISVVGYSARRLEQDAGHIIALAEAEGLPGHAETIRIRTSDVRHQMLDLRHDH